MLLHCAVFNVQISNFLLVGLPGVEPGTSRLSGVRSHLLSYKPSLFGGDERIRTADPLLARQVLSQLSYTPICVLDFQNRTVCLFFTHILSSVAP
jgi:hypothetical protein